MLEQPEMGVPHGGKFSGYLKNKVAKGELAPSIAQLAISALVPSQITGP
jgi:hypothetical protein